MANKHQKNSCQGFENDLTLFFSLPFYPEQSKNRFYNGHMALGLGDKVYQAYNPKLLKSDFLISVMPLREWLYEDSHFWVDRDKGSNQYRHVYLYKKSETTRTSVYYASFSGGTFLINQSRELFEKMEFDYQKGVINFHILNFNCATIINTILYQLGFRQKNLFDFLPSSSFNSFVKEMSESQQSIKVGKLSAKTESGFNRHRVCLGLPSCNAESYMDNYLLKQSLEI